ncbi:MAG: PTS sugar transporter subunit IIA [Calditrichia bacterium]
MKLIDVLKPEYIKIPLQGNSKEAVIKELIQILTEQGQCDDPEKVFTAVMDREKIMTTGVGKGVAIPHCKKELCRNFAIAFGIHPQGIDFQSIDNQPAHIFFLLVGPESNPGMHIRLLSRISRLISKNSLRDDLLRCSNAQECYQLLKNEEEKYFEMAS